MGFRPIIGTINFILNNNKDSIGQERNNRSWLIVVHSASFTRRVEIEFVISFGYRSLVLALSDYVYYNSITQLIISFYKIVPRENNFSIMSDQTKPTDQPPPLSFLFRLVIVACGLFVVTIFALVASLLSDSNSSMINFLNRHGSTLIGCEVVGIILLSVIALKFDRSPILRNMKQYGSRYDDPADDSNVEVDDVVEENNDQPDV